MTKVKCHLRGEPRGRKGRGQWVGSSHSRKEDEIEGSENGASILLIHNIYIYIYMYVYMYMSMSMYMYMYM